MKKSQKFILFVVVLTIFAMSVPIATKAAAPQLEQLIQLLKGLNLTDAQINAILNIVNRPKPNPNPSSPVSLMVTKSTSSPSGIISTGAQNVELARFNLKANNDKIEIRKLGVHAMYYGSPLVGTLIIADAETSEQYLNISTNTAGLQTKYTPNAGTLLANQRDLSSYITIEKGQTKTIKIIGSVGAAINSNYIIYIGQAYAKRYSTNSFVTLANSAYAGNRLTVKSSALTVVKNSSFANISYAPGSSGVKLAEFVLQASNADDINVNTIHHICLQLLLPQPNAIPNANLIYPN